jgi:uncharacterized protein YndB with AHSA1/START domain
MSAPTNEDDRRGELTISRVFNAPRDLVWRAFTEPEHLAAFWGGPGITVPVESVTMDVRRGQLRADNGSFRWCRVPQPRRVSRGR